jgi:hypothetical protein
MSYRGAGNQPANPSTAGKIMRTIFEFEGERHDLGGDSLVAKAIATAPRDGTFVRLYFRPGFGRETANGILGQWQVHEEMPAGGSWFDKAGNYITPGPIAWLPETGTYQ